MGNQNQTEPQHVMYLIARLNNSLTLSFVHSRRIVYVKPALRDLYLKPAQDKLCPQIVS